MGVYYNYREHHTDTGPDLRPHRQKGEKNMNETKKMTCGATGRECTCQPNERGEYPCKTCEYGKAWQNEPTLHDDI